MSFLAFIILIASLKSGLSQEKPFTPRAIFAFDVLTDVAISPNGKDIVYSLLKPKPPFTFELYTVNILTGEQSQLTQTPTSERRSQWSKQSDKLAYLVAGKDEDKIVVMDWKSRKVIDEITSNDIGAFKWSANGESIIYSGNQVKSKVRSLFKTDVEEPLFHQLTEYNFSTGQNQIIFSDKLVVLDFEDSPVNAKKAIITASSNLGDQLYNSNLLISDTAAGESITTPSRRQLLWSKDGNRVLTFNGAGKYGKTSLPVLLDLQSGQEQRLAENYRGYVNRFLGWSGSGDSFYFQGVQGAQSIIGAYNLKTNQVIVLAETGLFSNSYSSADNDLIAFLKGGHNQPAEIWITNAKSGESRKLTNHNSGASNYAFGQQQLVQWNSTDGKRIEGVLVRPVDYDPAKKYPLVTLLHGGPENDSWTMGWNVPGPDWSQFLAGAGVMTFLPNVRGSWGYGVEFIEANYGDLGGKDVEDVLSGIDYLVNQGMVDESRLGIGGWSYGGYLTSMVISRSNKFKAAVIGGGTEDFKSQYYSTDNSVMLDYYFQGNPVDSPKSYERSSSLGLVQNVTTPTLIIHGEDDQRVDVQQAYTYYKALRIAGVQTELRIYPAMGHSMLPKPAQNVSLIGEMLKWFQRHL